MHSKELAHAGSKSTVFASFLHFDLCFTIWVLIGALGVYITNDLPMNAAEKGLMVAIPTLSGSLTRIIIGLLSDRIGGKLVGTAMLVFLFIPLLMGWLLPINFPLIVLIGLMLGVAGASFAVALPLASYWYPPSQQGLVMGIAAAGNIGTVISHFFAPRLASIYGWQSVMGLSLIPLALVLLAFVLMAKDSPTRPKGQPIKKYLATLSQGDIWWFCLFYSVTFGGFVGLGTFLPIFFNGHYQLDAIDAGMLTALAALMGSTLRPLGGYLADKFGGVPVLSLLLALIGILYIAISLLLPIGITAWFIVICVTFLGMGNGAVFQLVPLRFQKEVGIATGLVGAFGGIGGFLLPTMLGSVKQFNGSYSLGWAVLAGCSLATLLVLGLLVAFHQGWRLSLAHSIKSEVAVD